MRRCDLLGSECDGGLGCKMTEKQNKMFPQVVELPLCPSCMEKAVDLRFGFGACLKCRHDLTAEEGFHILVRRMEVLDARLTQTETLAIEAHDQTARIG